jgi:2'-5' RNA ligase
MSADTIGIVSNLEEEPYQLVKRYWNLFERKFNSVAIQDYSHPHVSYQAARTNNIRALKKDFEKIIAQIKPFEIEVNGVRQFDEKVIYLGIKKTTKLVKIHKLIHSFLKDNCHGLFKHYAPEIWIPHVTLAMDDLSKANFKKAWFELKDSKIEFKQSIHNVCMVKWYPGGKIKIAKRYRF